MENLLHKPFEPEIKRKSLKVCPKCYGQGCVSGLNTQNNPDDLLCKQCNGEGWIDNDSGRPC